MGEPVVRVENVSRYYGGVRALSDVSFSIDGPGVVGVLGPNGAGKTSLLDLLAGLAQPASGSIWLFGAPLGQGAYPRRDVGVVLQREFVPDHMSVVEYAELFAAIHGVKQGAARILERAGLGARARVPVSKLSGGEAQRLFIAAALVHEPRLVLLDEPSVGLDPNHKRALGESLRELGKSRTLIMTTHDLAEADQICDRCLFMVGATLRAQGKRAELLAASGASDIEQAFFHYCGTRVAASGDAA
ncbi:MAG: ABC transporter ATP-binding protein [Polyangiaceae bacterium]